MVGMCEYEVIFLTANDRPTEVFKDLHVIPTGF